MGLQHFSNLVSFHVSFTYSAAATLPSNKPSIFPPKAFALTVSSLECSSSTSSCSLSKGCLFLVTEVSAQTWLPQRGHPWTPIRGGPSPSSLQHIFTRHSSLPEIGLCIHCLPPLFLLEKRDPPCLTFCCSPVPRTGFGM